MMSADVRSRQISESDVLAGRSTVSKAKTPRLGRGAEAQDVTDWNFLDDDATRSS